MTNQSELHEAFKRYTYFPRTKLNYWTFRKLRALKTREVGDKGWLEFFDYITRDVNLEPTLHERVQEGTQQSLLQDWMLNFADNLANIRYGEEAKLVIPDDYHQQSIKDLLTPSPVLEMEEDFAKEGDVLGVPITFGQIKGMKVKYPPVGSAVVVGRGPSLFKKGHLPMLAEAIETGQYKGLVVASDGGLIPCLEAHVVPDVVVTVDGAPIIRKWFDHPLVKEYGSHIAWILSVTVSHEVYQLGVRAGLKAYWFNPMFDDWHQNESWTRLQRLLSRTPKYMRGVPAANAGGNAGACAWVMAMSLFHRAPVALIGLDLGYPEGTPLQDTHYFEKVLKEAKGNVSVIKEAYPKFYHPVFKEHAFVDLVFYHYRQAFLSMQASNPMWFKLYGGTINCTEGGTLFGLGIKCMKFKEFLEKWKK